MTPDELRFDIMSRVGRFGNLYMFAAESHGWRSQIGGNNEIDQC